MIGRLARRVAVVGGMAAVVALAGAATSALHLKLDKSEPAADATVHGSPAAVHLWFSEAPQAKLTSVKVTGADGNAIDLKPAAAEEDAKHIVATVPSQLAAGAYSLTWRTQSKDGHVVNGTFGFTVMAHGQD